MVQEHHRADSLGDVGSLRPGLVFPRFASDRTAPQQPHAVNGASLPPGTKAPTDTRRAQRRLKIALVGALLVIVPSLVAVAASWWREVGNNVATTVPSATQAHDDLAQVKQAPQREPKMWAVLSRNASDEASQAQPADQSSAAELRQALQEERVKAESLARDLATAWRELRSQATALGDRAVLNQQLTDSRQELQQTESQSAAYQELLAQERARNRRLEEQLAARRDATPGRGRNATASLSDTPDPAQVAATDKPATARLPTIEKPVVPASDKSATIAARPTAPEAPGNPEATRLMARARLLVGQGDIVAARVVLERAAETGSAPALFALAETYDPAILSAWGTFGTQGDVAKAQELYAKAFAGGVQEAKDRLTASR